MNQNFLTVLVLLFGVVVNAGASVIGLPQQTTKIGVATGAGLFKVSDPGGETASSFVVQPVQVVISDWFKGQNRYWLSFYHQQYSSPASQDHIGQTVQQSGVRAIVQRNIALFSHWMPWVGMGFDAGYGEYRLRHQMDDDGYLTQRFADRSSPGLGFVMNLTSEWRVSRYWSAGFQLEQVIPFGDANRSTSANLLVLYNI